MVETNLQTTGKTENISLRLMYFRFLKTWQPLHICPSYFAFNVSNIHLNYFPTKNHALT
jgi:hypothetical protein